MIVQAKEMAIWSKYMVHLGGLGKNLSAFNWMLEGFLFF